MAKNHSRAWLCFAVVFTAAIYAGILLLLKPKMDNSSWTLFAFTIAAFVLVVIQLSFGSGGKGSLPQFSYAQAVVSTAYVLLQWVFGGIVLMFFEELPFVPVFCTELIFMAAYLVYTFVFSATLSHAQEQETQVADAVNRFREFVTELEYLAAVSKDSEVKSRLQTSSKELQYQDVITSPELSDLNGRIAQCIVNIREALSDSEYDPLKDIDRLDRLITERKFKAKAVK